MIVHQFRAKMHRDVVCDRKLTHDAIWKAYQCEAGTIQPFQYRVLPASGDELPVDVRSVEMPNLERFDYPVIDSRQIVVEIRKAKYSFVLDAYPSKRLDAKSIRLIQSVEGQLDWLAMKLAPAGVILDMEVYDSYSVLVGKERGFRQSIVGFRGTILIENPDEAVNLYVGGVGRRRAWGLGMLSLKILMP